MRLIKLQFNLKFKDYDLLSRHAWMILVIIFRSNKKILKHERLKR